MKTALMYISPVAVVPILAAFSCASSESVATGASQGEPTAIAQNQKEEISAESAFLHAAKENEALFASESRDEAWAPGREAEILRAMRNLPGVRDISAECMSRICKIKVAFSDTVACQEFDNNLQSATPHHELFVGGVATLQLFELRTTALTLWMSRPGYGFPSRGAPPRELRTNRDGTRHPIAHSVPAPEGG